VIPLLKTFTIPFRRRYPDVNLRVTILSAFDGQQAFEESSLDIAITYSDKALRRYNRIRVLYTEEYELLIRKGSTFSGRTSVSWEELGAVTSLPAASGKPHSWRAGSSAAERNA
jgi:DNA-binding transcriptional LysR family regulator